VRLCPLWALVRFKWVNFYVGWLGVAWDWFGTGVHQIFPGVSICITYVNTSTFLQDFLGTAGDYPVSRDTCWVYVVLELILSLVLCLDSCADHAWWSVGACAGTHEFE
jgi:hypothetical protein